MVTSTLPFWLFTRLTVTENMRIIVYFIGVWSDILTRRRADYLALVAGYWREEIASFPQTHLFYKCFLFMLTI